MSISTTSRLGLQLTHSRPSLRVRLSSRSPTRASTKSPRQLSTAALRQPPSTVTSLAANPPSSNTPSSFFTPSLCRIRHASTASASASAGSQSASSVVLDWNTFFRLRASRRRYALVSSILTSAATTGAVFTVFVESPELADYITKLVPTDPFISMGIATFGATFFGWLIGPAFGNSVWRLLHRSRLPEFTVKERAFFDRIKNHRVNPSGASTNNPVPDFYGEKVGSVAGYRRWLKDQRAFNRKRGGSYPS